MREIRLYGSEGAGAACSPYPYLSNTGVPALAVIPAKRSASRNPAWIPAFAGMTHLLTGVSQISSRAVQSLGIARAATRYRSF